MMTTRPHRRQGHGLWGGVASLLVILLLDRPTLARLVDPVNYLGAAGELVDRVLAKFEKGQKS